MLALLFSVLEDEGDRARFFRLHRKYERRMYRVAFSILKDHHRAEECVHDAFCKIILHFSKISEIPCQEIEPWIVTIVKNTALNIRKRDSRREELPDTWDAPAAEGTESEAGYRRLVELIRSMPEGYRQALELKFVLEQSNREIGRALGISEDAAAQRVARGRALLIQRLKEEGYEP